MTTITETEIQALRDEAASAGDTEMVRICDRALDGSQCAIAECRRVIRAARDARAGGPGPDAR
jgi:hypothetical protein